MLHTDTCSLADVHILFFLDNLSFSEESYNSIESNELAYVLVHTIWLFEHFPDFF